MSTREPIDVERLRAALASPTPEPDAGAPADAGRIFDAVHGKLSAAERAAIVDATVDDADAAEAWRLAMDLGPPPTAVAAPVRGVPWTWLGIAAVLALAVGVGWQQLGVWRTGDAPVYRSAGERTITSLLPPDASLSRQAPVLRWTAIEGARYRIRVLSADLEPLGEASELTAADYTLPPEVVSRVPAGSTVLWQVEADVPGGATVVSPTFSTRVR